MDDLGSGDYWVHADAKGRITLGPGFKGEYRVETVDGVTRITPADDEADGK